VDAIAINSARKLLASASADKTIRLWDPSSGHCAQTLVDHKMGVQGLAFSHDGKLLASSSADKTIRLWGPAS
jgi:WD40 repeat protein